MDRESGRREKERRDGRGGWKEIQEEGGNRVAQKGPTIFGSCLIDNAPLPSPLNPIPSHTFIS